MNKERCERKAKAFIPNLDSVIWCASADQVIGQLTELVSVLSRYGFYAYTRAGSTGPSLATAMIPTHSGWRTADFGYTDFKLSAHPADPHTIQIVGNVTLRDVLFAVCPSFDCPVPCESFNSLPSDWVSRLSILRTVMFPLWVASGRPVPSS